MNLHVYQYRARESMQLSSGGARNTSGRVGVAAEFSVYVGNLDPETSLADMEELLYELFIQAGPLSRVYIPFVPETGRHKGYGFAEFLHKESVLYAMKLLYGMNLCGRMLNVRSVNINGVKETPETTPTSGVSNAPTSVTSSQNPFFVALSVQGEGNPPASTPPPSPFSPPVLTSGTPPLPLPPFFTAPPFPPPFITRTPLPPLPPPPIPSSVTTPLFPPPPLFFNPTSLDGSLLPPPPLPPFFPPNTLPPPLLPPSSQPPLCSPAPPQLPPPFISPPSLPLLSTTPPFHLARTSPLVPPPFPTMTDQGRTRLHETRLHANDHPSWLRENVKEKLSHYHLNKLENTFRNLKEAMESGREGRDVEETASLPALPPNPFFKNRYK